MVGDQFLEVEKLYIMKFYGDMMLAMKLFDDVLLYLFLVAG